MKGMPRACCLTALLSASAFAALRPADITPKQRKQLDKLAERYHVRESELVKERDKGVGWDQLGIAMAVAKRSGRPLSEVMALSDSGMGWSDIARKYGFSLGDIQRSAKAAEKAGEKLESRKAHRSASHGRGASAGHGGRARHPLMSVL